MYIGAIADDLTGATDLALMLSREGLRVLQVVGVPEPGIDFGDAEAVVISLKSRTIPSNDAVAMSLASADALIAGGARQLFFKYCSTFDSTDAGNIGPVTDGLLKHLGESCTIACPAFPANKRTVYKGHLFVGDQLLSDSPMRDHPLTPMRDSNLVSVLSRQSSNTVSLIDQTIVSAGATELEAAFDKLTGIAIVDAITDGDLRAIGAAARGFRLVTGGSGVALGLPANFLPAGHAIPAPRPVTVPNGRAVILAGSCSVATRRQVAHAIQSGAPALRLDAFEIANGTMTVDMAVGFAIEHDAALPPLLYSSADPQDVTKVQEVMGRDASGTIVENFLGSVASRLAESGFNRFIVAGGETSGAIVAALNVTALEIGPEIAPGVPWTCVRNTDRPLALALKSGNFGDEAFFLKAAEMIG